MITILVVGSDTALLEGVTQTLVGAGKQVVIAGDAAEAYELLGATLPLVAIVSCDQLLHGGGAFRLPLAHGGALIAYHCDEDDMPSLPFPVRRATLAELSLPLERQRLLALVHFVENRARAAGRDSDLGGTADSGLHC